MRPESEFRNIITSTRVVLIYKLWCKYYGPLYHIVFKAEILAKN